MLDLLKAEEFPEKLVAPGIEADLKLNAWSHTYIYTPYRPCSLQLQFLLQHKNGSDSNISYKQTINLCLASDRRRPKSVKMVIHTS